jgi:hypothetical protein
LFTDERLRTLPAAFATVPDPRKRRGQRYDLPFLLLCLVGALLCDCNSLEAVGRWTRDHRTVLARVWGPRRHLSSTGSLYRRLLPRLSVAHVERALAGWVQQTRPRRDREPLAGDGKGVRGARTETQAAPHLLSISTHDTHETLVQVRVDDKTNEIPVLQELLPHLPLRGRVVTADALHTQSALAQLLLDHHAAYLLTLKDNQPRLRAELAAYCTDRQATARVAMPPPWTGAAGAPRRAPCRPVRACTPTCTPTSPFQALRRSPNSRAPCALRPPRAAKQST